jgi:hypothetical protein
VPAEAANGVGPNPDQCSLDSEARPRMSLRVTLSNEEEFFGA